MATNHLQTAEYLKAAHLPEQLPIRMAIGVLSACHDPFEAWRLALA